MMQPLPDRPIIFTDVQSVQEQFEWPIRASFLGDHRPDLLDGPAPSMKFRFCEFHVNYDALDFVPGWYDALDYAVSSMNLAGNLTILPGTGVGMKSPRIGFPGAQGWNHEHAVYRKPNRSAVAILCRNCRN